MINILSIVCLKLSLNSVLATSQTFVLSHTYDQPFRLIGRYANGPMLEWGIDFYREPTVLLSDAPEAGDLEFIAEDETVLRGAVVRGSTVERRPEPYHHFGPRIGITRTSVIGRNLFNAALLPRGEGHIMKTNVVNLAEYCHPDSPIQYTYMILARVEFSVNLVNQQSSEILPISTDTPPRRDMFTSLSTSSKSRVPRFAFNHIEAEVIRNGCSEDALNSLPKIEYSNRNYGVAVYMFPEDYVVNVAGQCQLLIESNFDGYTWEDYTWGRNMLRNLGVLIDFVNSRLGICDPL